MLKLNIEDSLVFIIDIQEKLLNAVFNKETCAKNSKIIANAAHILEIPVIVTEQYPKGLGNTVEDIKTGLGNNAEYFEKTAFSALDINEIKNYVQKHNKKQIVIFGIETHICLSQTVAELVKAGYEVHVIKDASGSRSEEEHLAGLERIKDNRGHIITTEIALFEWLKTAMHPNFKEIQSLIK